MNIGILEIENKVEAMEPKIMVHDSATEKICVRVLCFHLFVTLYHSFCGEYLIKTERFLSENKTPALTQT